MQASRFEEQRFFIGNRRETAQNTHTRCAYFAIFREHEPSRDFHCSGALLRGSGLTRESKQRHMRTRGDLRLQKCKRASQTNTTQGKESRVAHGSIRRCYLDTRDLVPLSVVTFTPEAQLPESCYRDTTLPMLS